jgi:hypothetical protein
MASVPFDRLPASARLWVFAAERPLDAGRARAGARRRRRVPVDLESTWRPADRRRATCCYDRFLLVGVDEASAGASGCSIDAMVHHLESLERSMGVALLDHGPVLFRQDDAIERLPRPAFAELARRGDVSPDTIVFDNTVSRVGDVREGPVGAAGPRVLARSRLRPVLTSTAARSTAALQHCSTVARAVTSLLECQCPEAQGDRAGLAV